MYFDGQTLVISPHVDDEVLGCFAFLGPSTHVLYGGIEDRPSREQRLLELKHSAEALGFTWDALDEPVNSFDSARLIGPIEAAINAREPVTVLVPEPSYNQDHRAVHDASIVATRPHDRNHRVARVLLYEQPHSVMWPHESRPATPPPSVFIPIDIDAKIEAYSRYESQVRGHRSFETVRALAALRGAQIGVPHAEAFHPRRIIAEVAG